MSWTPEESKHHVEYEALLLEAKPVQCPSQLVSEPWHLSARLCTQVAGAWVRAAAGFLSSARRPGHAGRDQG